ncbi:hypothetical protein [Brevundimonas sp. NPDC058933]|uniref:hypothetical protein n=1 Tax=Brevundimonas sp. NPDC058933 TaxID=3346673 RepID=UPI003BEED541
MMEDQNQNQIVDEAPDGDAEARMAKRRFWWQLLGWACGAVVAIATGYWLIERFIGAQFSADENSRLSFFFSKIVSDLLQVGLPALIVILVIGFVTILGAQFAKSTLRGVFGIKEDVDSTVYGRHSFDYMEARRAHFLRAGSDISYSDDESEVIYPGAFPRSRRLQRKIETLEAKLEEVNSSSGVFTRMCNRLGSERDRLSSNSKTNLLIGIVSTLLAIGVLGLPLVSPSVISGTESISDASFWRQYATRLPVGILLQFVAFFFLRLYVSCEMDIKSNKNEITNIEAQYLAYLMTQYGNPERASFVVQKLAETERNFIIRRGEKTIGVENDSRYNDLKESLDRVLGAVSVLLGADKSVPK